MGERPYIGGGIGTSGTLLNSVEYFEAGQWVLADFVLPVAIRNAGAIAVGPSRFLLFGGSRKPTIATET
jgi:hypothetical protein